MMESRPMAMVSNQVNSSPLSIYTYENDVAEIISYEKELFHYKLDYYFYEVCIQWVYSVCTDVSLTTEKCRKHRFIINSVK